MVCIVHIVRLHETMLLPHEAVLDFPATKQEFAAKMFVERKGSGMQDVEIRRDEE